MNNTDTKSVQDQYAEKSICFGCGPTNKNGLQIKSYRSDHGLDLWFETKPEHQAFPGVINGGIIGSLFDCHGNWAAAVALLDTGDYKSIPSTVTASYSVELIRPTPFGVPLYIQATIKSQSTDKAEIEMELYADKDLCAKGRGLFIAVKEGHPAYHRW